MKVAYALWSAVAAAVICAMTGVLLSMYYVPSAEVARDADGQPVAIGHATAEPLVDAWGDTVALLGQYAAVPTKATPASIAQVSVDVSIANAWGGTVVRTLHRAAALACVGAVLITMTLLAVERRFSHKWIWLASVVMLVGLLFAAWTGMVLPDDAYSMASVSVVRTGIADGIAGGGLLEGLTNRGIAAVQPLARTYGLHALVLPLVLAMVLRVLVRHCEPLPIHRWAGIGCAAVLISVPLAIYRPDGSRAWYPFRVAGVLQEAVGNELASYVVLAWMLAVTTIPWWHVRSNRWTAPALVIAGLVLYVLSAVFG